LTPTPTTTALERAVAAGSRFILTGDDDLLRLGAYAGIRILKGRRLPRADSRDAGLNGSN
jgi:hypothetical protein